MNFTFDAVKSCVKQIFTNIIKVPKYFEQSITLPEVSSLAIKTSQKQGCVFSYHPVYALPNMG